MACIGYAALAKFPTLAFADRLDGFWAKWLYQRFNIFAADNVWRAMHANAQATCHLDLGRAKAIEDTGLHRGSSNPSTSADARTADAASTSGRTVLGDACFKGSALESLRFAGLGAVDVEAMAAADPLQRWALYSPVARAERDLAEHWDQHWERCSTPKEPSNPALPAC